MRPLSAVLLAAAIPILSGCAGYTVGPIKPTVMKSVQTIAVASFKNDTLHPRVEVLVANAVIKQIQQDGTYQIADEKTADVILEGTIEGIDRRPSRSVRGNVLQTREFVTVIRARVRIYRRDTGVDLDTRLVTGTSNFFVTGSRTIAADVIQDERQAIPLAAEEMAVRLVSQISEGW